jgi:hypothetical protein
VKRIRATAAAAIGISAVVAAVGVNGAAQASRANATSLTARIDAFHVTEGDALRTHRSILANDRGRPTAIVSHTDPAHGRLALSPDGTFTYVPAKGFTGVDSFAYTASDAVTLYKTHLPPITAIGGTTITGGAFGSAVAAVPESKNLVYGLTDRGPNVDGPNGETVEPLPAYVPAIGKFRLVHGKAALLKRIPLKASDGTPFNGQVNPESNTGETIVDLNGNALPTSPYGYDPEGLVALRDGTFWISDEYGPYITHFNRNGREIGRLSPYDGSLPGELKYRVPNKGMEGLTITPNGRLLVGIMQSTLQTPGLTAKAANVAVTRVVTYDLRTRATHEYLYLLDDPAVHAGANSEITALSNTTFVVDERDGAFQPGGYKRLFKINISNATDVGPRSRVRNTSYDADAGGLLVGPDQVSIEAYVQDADTATAAALLSDLRIRPVKKTSFLDLGALLTTLDPSGGFFGHDKVEGVATTDHGRHLIISNDNDFGISGLADTTPPYQLASKILPNGQQDDGEYLVVDVRKARHAASASTVRIFVTPRHIHH